MKNKILILLLILFYGCQEKEETCFFSSGEKLNERVIKKLISNDECRFTLREIKKINLSNQKLKDINFLSELPNIEFLDLSNNLISNIKPIKSLGKLKFLNLRNNYIEEINDLKSNKKLEKVLLEGNVIKGEEDYCPTDFELKKLNDFCLKLSEISKLEISLSKVSNDRCSQDKPINLLLKKNWGKIGLLNKKNEIIKKNDFGSWSGFMRQMPLYDQGETGLCYAFAAIQLIDYWRETHGVKVTKKMAYSSPLYGAFLLKSLDKKELQNSLDYGYSAKVISYVKKNGMCRSDIINNSLKKINLGEDVTEIDFYKALKDVFKAKKMVSKDKLLKTAKRYDLENYASLSLNSKSLVDAFQIIFSECKKPTSIYLNSKNIPEPTVIRIESLERKKMVKRTIRYLLNKKRAQPVGVTYCSHFLNNDKGYRGVSIEKGKAFVNDIKKCKMHASILVGKKRKCHDQVLQNIIRNYLVGESSLSKNDFDEIISETYLLLIKNQGDIGSDRIGDELLKQIKKSNYVWDKKINWNFVKKILKSEYYRDPASIELDGVTVIKNLCKIKNNCKNSKIKEFLKDYKNREVVTSQEDFVDKIKKIFHLIYPSLHIEELENILLKSMAWTKKINWEKLKEDLIPFLNSGGVGSFRRELYSKCEEDNSGGCYYLLRNTWSRGKNNKECSSSNWQCRLDGRGQVLGTWVHEEALLNNLHKIFYLDTQLNSTID